MSSQQNGDDEKKSGAQEIVGQILHARSEGEKAEERRTKVIVDADGNKVVKVTKRKRVYVEPTEDRKSGPEMKSIFLGFVIFAVIFVLVFGGIFVFRVSSFNSEEFLTQKQKELSALWGADVKLEDLTVDGFTFRLGALHAQFPETSMLERIDISSIRGDLQPSCFITGIFQGDQVSASSVKIVLRSNTPKVNIPVAQGDIIWKYNRYLAEQFEVEYSDRINGPFIWQGSLYLRKTQSGDNVHVAQLEGGLKIRGWHAIAVNVSAPTVFISPNGIDSISINGVMSDDPDNNPSLVEISGAIPNGTSIYEANLKLTGTGILLKDLTNDAFKGALTAVLGKPSTSGNEEMELSFSLPSPGMAIPAMSGNLNHLNWVEMGQFPALKLLGSIVGNENFYNAPSFRGGSMQLVCNGRKVDLREINLEDSTLLKVTGNLSVVDGGELSGNLNFGVPYSNATRDTYDPDPLFDVSDHNTVWLHVTVSGRPSQPRDNSRELDAGVKHLRKQKPVAPKAEQPSSAPAAEKDFRERRNDSFAPGTGEREGATPSPANSFEDFLH